MIRRLSYGALAAALLAGGCGKAQRHAPPTRDPFAVAGRSSAATAHRAAPRWERVNTLVGNAPRTADFDIARGAIQWRARWSCRRGRLTLMNRPETPGALANARCPKRGAGVSVSTGPQRLTVTASDAWRVVIEQQVDTPLNEAPLRQMTAPGAHVIGRGRFYPIERRGKGAAIVYRLPGGRLVLRLAGFDTLPNRDLVVWLSPHSRPRTTVEAFRGPHLVLGPLKSTLGNENYVLPAGTTPDEVRSVVIWCVPVRIAYTAAALQP